MYISKFYRDTYVLLISNIFYIFCYLILTSAIVRVYGLEAYSIVNYIIVIHGFLMILFTGISASITGHIISKEKENNKFPINYVRSVEILYFFLGILILIILFGVYFLLVETNFFFKIENLSLLNFKFFWITLIIIILSRFLISFYDSVLVAKKKFKEISYIKFFLSTNYLLISIIIFFNNIEFKIFVLIFIISNLINTLIYYIVFKKLIAKFDKIINYKLKNLKKDLILTLPKYLAYSGIGLITLCSISLMNFYAINILNLKDFAIYGLISMIVSMSAHLNYPVNNVLFSYSINYYKKSDDNINYGKALYIFLVNLIISVNIFFIFKNTILKLWLGAENFELINSFIFFVILIFILKSISEISSSLCISKNKAENLLFPRILLICSLILFFLLSKNLDLNSFIKIKFYFYLMTFIISYFVIIRTGIAKLVNNVFFIIIFFIFIIFLPKYYTYLNYNIKNIFFETNIYFLIIFFINIIIFSIHFIKFYKK